MYATSGINVYLSYDGGVTATQIGTGSLEAMTLKGDTLFVAFNLCWGDKDGIFYTVDDGVTWVQVIEGYDLLDTEYEMCSSDRHVFVACAKGVYRSADNGTAWEKVLYTSYLQNGGAFSITCQDSLIVVGSAGKVFISTDDGTSWTSSALPNAQVSVWEVNIHDGKIFAGTTKGLYVSTDLGNTWALKGSFGVNVACITFCGDIALLGGANDMDGILYSENGGETWMPCNTGLDLTYDVTIRNIIFYQGHFIAGCDMPLQRSPDFDCSAVTGIQNAKEGLLFIASPNPTAEGLAIQTDLNDYTLTVYDVNGRQVFFQNGLSANYSLPEHALPVAGVYRLILTAKGTREYKSIIKI